MTQPSWEGAPPAGGWGPPPDGNVPGGWASPTGSPPGSPPGGIEPFTATSALAAGWALLKRDFFGVMVPIFVGYLLAAIPSLLISFGTTGYTMYQIKLGKLPDPADPVLLISQLASMFTSALMNGFFLGGLSVFSLKVARGEAYSFGDVFSGGRFFLAQFGVALFFAAISLPVLVVYHGMMIGGIPQLAAALVACVLAIPVIIVLLGLSVAHQALVDRDLGTMAALRESWRLTSGHRISIGLAIALLTLLGVPALCACGLGIPPLIALTSVTFASWYLRLSGQPGARIEGDPR